VAVDQPARQETDLNEGTQQEMSAAAQPVQVDPDASNWRFAQCFGDKGEVEDITEADIIVRSFAFCPE
jgi:hypothetical protein